MEFRLKLIRYQDKNFKGYLELFFYLAHKIKDERELIRILDCIPPSRVFFTKAGLESEFNKTFSFKEIREILKDKSWQWRTPSQTSEYLGRVSLASRQDLYFLINRRFNLVT